MKKSPSRQTTMASKWISKNGKWKLSPEWLLTLKTIRTVRGWDLKLEENYGGKKHRYYTGGYFDEKGEWREPIVTHEIGDGESWFQAEQYGMHGE